MCALNFKQNYCSQKMDREENLPRQGTAREDQITTVLSSLVDCAQGSDDKNSHLEKTIVKHAGTLLEKEGTEEYCPLFHSQYLVL